ncbi:hypothetical protein [Chryseobacterium jejuense]|uniref:Uncharacterized protein n=1 Tax=Chryseobacterium jejuense TaxID=445960 RepID=A0A2X2WXH5_CHRJE|nr:hypothetical protein [Chryseobacterium jejuense]SDJ31972.1 hypothetical protein SAMN05421542_3172 [Chryseobacterium jejuense]SQB45388.1 Uncharacterised protein [Chryseobacterium jejuense]
MSLIFENNTSQNIVFPTPNTLEFGDENLKKFSTQGNMEDSYPITVYAIIKDNQSSKFYQEKLDSIYDSFLTEIGNSDFIGDKKTGDGNSVFYLKEKEKLIIKYNLIIRQLPSMNYSSKFKQNYYPYDKVLKGNYPEGEYLRRFSKLNFDKAKFVAQPVIEDSLFLNISNKDANN